MSLTITKSYSNGNALTEAQLDSLRTSIETFFNVTKLDTTNFELDAVVTSNLASASVTTTKIPNTGITLTKLTQDLRSRLLITGSILSYVSESTPSGYLPCDGSAVSRMTYAALFTIVGSAYGSGDGSTTFNVPDFRGRFLRGVDGGATRDPNASTRTTMASGGNSGDAVGSIQGYATSRPTAPYTADSQGAHTHVATISAATFTAGSEIINLRATPANKSKTTSSNGAHTHTITGGGDSETRPINANICFYIKV